uniref:CCHC-type domain-containing protein n=1 Tax=Panagrolaimus davidi TaxID=227884 RepID=A0A914QRH6_9BILA
MEEQNRAGINKTMGCCIQHTRKVLMIIQGLFRQHGNMFYDEDLLALLEEADDILSAGVIGDVRRFSFFYHRLLTSLNRIIEDFQYSTTSPSYQNALNQTWEQLAGEYFVEPVIGAPLAADAWTFLPPAKFSAFRRKASNADDCTRCLQAGHSKDKCSNAVVCKTCSHEGHISRDCPQVRCTHCGRKGHAKDNCQWIGGLPLCHRCEEPGHFWSRCPNPVKCWKCGGEGHMSRDCPQR